MKRFSGTGLVVAGMFLGALLTGSAAYAAGVMAERSATPIFVNGSPAEVEAYAINGNNYMKLRDIAKLTNFGVFYNAETGIVSIDTMVGYTEEIRQAQETEPEPESRLTAYHEQANRAIFDNVYTKEAFDALYAAIHDKGETVIPMSVETWAAMDTATAAISTWPSCEVKAAKNGYRFAACYPETCQKAVDYCAGFIQSLKAMSEEQKIREIAFYVCERLDYQADTWVGPSTVLISDSVSKGNCMSFAHNFQFLCNLAEIPCILVHSDTHQWNQVYVNGRWQDVDVTGTDVGFRTRVRTEVTVLREPMALQGAMYSQTDRESVTFAKEALVPGSTR